MDYNHSKLENRMRAKTLLDQLKRRLVDVSGATIEVATGTAQVSMEWWRLSKAAGVHVYAAKDGWHCDIVFKDLPIGIPTIVGSAVPYPSRGEALEHAVQQLSLMAVNDKLPTPAATDGVRYFKFDNIEIPVGAAMMATFPKDLAAEGYTEFQARGRLAYFRHAIANDRPMSGRIFNSLEPELQARITVACGIAMTYGIQKFAIEDGVWADFEDAPDPDADSSPRM